MLARVSLVLGLLLAASTSSAVPLTIIGTNDLHGQVERVQESRGDVPAYTKAITAMTNEVERLLGVP